MASTDSVWIELFNGTTGTGSELPCGNATQVVVEYEWADDCSAGAVSLEHSAVSGYTGTWAEVDAQTFLDNGKQIWVRPGPMGFLRPRVTTNVSGGAAPGLIVRAKRQFGA